MRNRFNLNESEKNRIKNLHGIKVIKEEETEGREETGKIMGFPVNLLTPAVKEHLGKKVTTLKMLQIIADCFNMSDKAGPLWAGLGPSSYRSPKGGPYPRIQPSSDHGTITGYWGQGGQLRHVENLKPCRLHRIPEGWRRSDFLVPAIVNFWKKLAGGISNTPYDGLGVDADDSKVNKMSEIGEKFTWAPDGNNGQNTMWTLKRK